MRQEDSGKFASIMFGVAENFGGKISPEGIGLRFSVLKEYKIEQIVKAGEWLLRNREQTFPAVPTVKEFVDAIHLQTMLGNSADMQADLVLKKLRYEGRNGKIDFEDPVTFELMTVRWPYNSWATKVKEDDLKWWRKDFCEAYNAHSKVNKVEQIPLELKGLLTGIGETI